MGILVDAEFGINTSWVEGKMEIKKSLLNFIVKFWWNIIRHKLSLTTIDNVIILDQAVLIISLKAGYDVDLARWIKTKIYERVFCEFTIILFLYLVQRLYAECV